MSEMFLSMRAKGDAKCEITFKHERIRMKQRFALPTPLLPASLAALTESSPIATEEFMASQPDPQAAKNRFDQWDADKKGFLTRHEFISQGGKAK